MSSTVVLGDSYLVLLYMWEDSAQTIPRDLTGLQSARYIVCATSDYSTILFESNWREDQYIVIPDLSKGFIQIDLRTDLLNAGKIS